MLLQFRTTTARTVGVLLDLVKLELRCWLNGNSLPNKTKAITKGKWYPCVQIKEKGNHVVLNPFAKITREIEQQVPHLYPKLVRHSPPATGHSAPPHSPSAPPPLRFRLAILIKILAYKFIAGTHDKYRRFACLIYSWPIGGAIRTFQFNIAGRINSRRAN